MLDIYTHPRSEKPVQLDLLLCQRAWYIQIVSVVIHRGTGRIGGDENATNPVLRNLRDIFWGGADEYRFISATTIAANTLLAQRNASPKLASSVD